MELGKLKLAMFATFVLLFGTVLALTGIIVWIIAPGIYGVSAYGLLIVLLGFTVGITLLQYVLGPYIIRAFTKMKPLEGKWLQDMADDLAKKACLKKTPKLYIVSDSTPNAFAFGYGKNHANIAIHTGLIELLNKDEIKSVLAHEMGHVKHNDMVLITIASMVPVFVYYLVIAIGSLLARSRDDEGMPSLFIFAGAYTAQFFTYLIVLYLSRTREYYADAFGAAATSPKTMRTSLAKIAYGFPAIGKKAKRYEKVRSFYITDPVAASEEREKRLANGTANKRDAHNDMGKEMSESMQWEREAAGAKILNIFSTHPLTYKRIDALYELEKGKLGVEDT